MELTYEDIKYKHERMCYWTRILAKSDDKESVILVCAPESYIKDSLELKKPITEADQKAWIDSVLNDIRKIGDAIFEHPVNYKVYSLTAAGVKNGMEFLKEITP